MTDDDEYERRQVVKQRARDRAATSPTGVGAAYMGLADRDPHDPPSKWTGDVVVSEGGPDSLVHLLVVAESYGRHDDVAGDALAEAIERLAAGGGIEHLRELTEEGPGIRIEVHAADAIARIFP